MKRVRRITAGRGSVSRSERTTLSGSASTTSAFPSMTNRNARLSGTIVSGSNEALSARQPTIKHVPPLQRRYNIQLVTQSTEYLTQEKGSYAEICAGDGTRVLH